jgi:DNA-binding response OmpR family regulator
MHARCATGHEPTVKQAFTHASCRAQQDGDPMRVLVVEDDPTLGSVVQRGLEEEGHAVDLAPSLGHARRLLSISQYGLVLLDLGLPDGDGLTLCRELRSGPDPASFDTRVLLLTARDSMSDKVAGLDAGADDYLTKPFDFPELAARVRALARRPAVTRSPELRAGDVQLDPATHVVRRGAVVIPLTAREFALLHELLARQGEVVTRSDLLDAVWDANYDGLSNVVDVHIANLRRKLDLPGAPAPIETIRGVGYRIVGP